MCHKIKILVPLWLLPFLIVNSFSESLHVRTFRVPGTYAAAVSVSPGGNVIAKSGEYSKVVTFDGFTRRDITIPEENNYRVYQSRSGQYWSIAQEGVYLFHATEWTLHPIPEIRNELQSNPIRQLRQITLLPAEVNHLLILMPDKLLDYDANSRRTGVLKLARDTRLGYFSEITEALDGTVLVSGLFGLARLDAPARKITAQTEWKEFILDKTNQVSFLQRLYDSPSGVITTVANPLDTGDRFIVQLEKGQWQVTPMKAEKVRHVTRPDRPPVAAHG